MPAPHSPYVDRIAPRADAPALMLLCEHGGAEIPQDYADLGLGAEDRFDHIAWDPGAAEVTRGLAAALGCGAVLSRASRLLIDPNRPIDDPTAIRVISDGRIVPGNRAVDGAERARRRALFFDPFHVAAAEAVAAAGPDAAVLAVHSFTPIYHGAPRRVEIGLLWADDDRMAAPLFAVLHAAGFVVAHNEPYSGRDGWGYTIPTHAADRPHVLIEIRNDLIAEPVGVARVVDAFAAGLRALPRHLGGLACGAHIPS